MEIYHTTQFTRRGLLTMAYRAFAVGAACSQNAHQPGPIRRPTTAKRGGRNDE